MQVGLRSTALKAWRSFRSLLSFLLNPVKALFSCLFPQQNQYFHPENNATVDFAFPRDVEATSYEYKYRFPLTDEQRQKNKEDFISSLNQESICTLASQHNNGMSCTITGTNWGSYNVAFFVEFSDGQRRVVRVPIVPQISDVQSKIESEVATMRYVKQKTTIPVPRVYSYGKCEFLYKDRCEPCWYMILEHMSGESPDPEEFEQRPASEQKRFYSEIDAILSQIWGLKFSCPGSLFPGAMDASEPVIGPFQDSVGNDMEVDTGRRRPQSYPLKSMHDVVGYLYSTLRDVLALPSENYPRDSVGFDIFIAYDIGAIMEKVLDFNQGAFSLNHMDLRMANLMVDSKLHIIGVVDWEWAMILPRQLCVRPIWLELSLARLQAPSEDKADEVAKEKMHNGCVDKLIAQTLLNPSQAVDIYDWFIFPKCYKEKLYEVKSTFFEDENQKKLLEARWDTNIQYTEFLKRNNLFVRDEKFEEYEEWCENTEKYLKARRDLAQ